MCYRYKLYQIKVMRAYKKLPNEHVKMIDQYLCVLHLI